MLFDRSLRRFEPRSCLRRRVYTVRANDELPTGLTPFRTGSRGASGIISGMLVWGCLVGGCFLGGCQKGASDGSSPGPGPGAMSQGDSQEAKRTSASDPVLGSKEDAKRLIDEALDVYRKATRYVDAGELLIEATGVPPVISPFRVAFERPNRLAFAVHSIRGGWTSTTWEAICSGAANPFPNQRLVRPLPARIDLDWIVNDNLGGLFADPLGLPIQLELLLSDQMLPVFSDTLSQLEFLQRDTTDGRECDRIRLERAELRWVLWIDRENKLLRKMELPPQLFYPGLTSEAMAGIRCEINLRGAIANSAIDWSLWQVPVRGEDVLVRRFVMPPPIASTQILGTTMEPFDLKDAGGSLLLDAAEPKRPISVLVWVGEDPASEAFVRELMNARRLLIQRELSARSEIFLIDRELSKTLPETLKKWNCDLPLAVDRTGISESLFHVPGEPSLVILDRDRRVQVSEWKIGPAAAASIPELVQRIDAREDLASRQLQQDADNQARFIAALHRVAIDKQEASKLEAIREFQFALHGMRRDWRTEFSDPLVSAGGTWFPSAALDRPGGVDVPFSGASKSTVLATLDELGKLVIVDDLGNKTTVGSVEIDQADGAQRIHTSIDPWSREWIAIVPEGLPRFWIAPAGTAGKPVVSSSSTATTFNTQGLESPVAFAWTAIAKEPVLAVATSESRLLVINPKTEQRLDALGEKAIAIAPGIDSEGQVVEWNTVSPSGHLMRIRNLSAGAGLTVDAPLEARLEQLTFEPKPGSWLWGRHGRESVTLSLAGLPSGETGVVLCNPQHQALRSRPITVRPEQSRLLSTARLSNGTLYGLASGPNRVLHLFTADLQIMDQVSLDARVLSAAIFPDGNNLKLVVALEKEVSAWSIDVPDRLVETQRTGEAGESTPSDAQ